MALTTDFTGTYDYEREEGENCASYWVDVDDYYTDEELIVAFTKESSHWVKVLGGFYPDFVEGFNSIWNNRRNIRFI